MENDILDILHDVGYEGPILDEKVYAEALEGGPKSLQYTRLVHILTDEIKIYCKLEEKVNIMNGPEDSNTFLLELSSFLKELGCPYENLVTGHISSRLQSKDDRVLLLEYLITELMAVRMVSVDAPKERSKSLDIVMQESQTAKDLKNILITLKFNKPPPNITSEMLFSRLEAKLQETIAKEGQQMVGKPLYNKTITEQEWRGLEEMFREMMEEYTLRRETLITRLDCTIKSFQWSDRLKDKKEQIDAAYKSIKEQLKFKPNVQLVGLLAARMSLLHVEKSSSANVRANTVCDVNKVIIGKVPDRGGRPNEQQPPPPEMPSWQQRAQAPPRGGGRGHPGSGGATQRGGGRGGRVQGGYNQNPGDNRQGGRGGYQTYDVPTRGYNTDQGGNHRQNQGYDAMGSYGQEKTFNTTGGYQSGGYNNRNYNDNNASYQNTGFSQNSGYQTSGYNDRNQGRGQGGYQRGYQNEHDDRTSDRRGRSNYQRGGRR